MTNLLELYVKLVSLVLVGYILGRRQSARVPNRLGQLLFWVGAPIGIVIFLRKADLSGQILIAAAIGSMVLLVTLPIWLWLF